MARPARTLAACPPPSAWPPAASPPRPLAGAAEAASSRQWGPAWVDPARIQGADSRSARSGCCFPPDQVVLGALQPARLNHAMGAEGESGSPASEPAAAAGTSGPNRRWLAAWLGRTLLPLRSGGSRPRWRLLRARSELSQQGAGALGCSRAGPGAARVNDGSQSTYELGAAERASSNKGPTWAGNPGQAATTRRQTTAPIDAGFCAPTSAAAAAGAWLETGTQLPDATANGRAITSCQRADRPAWVSIADLRWIGWPRYRTRAGRRGRRSAAAGGEPYRSELSIK